jgi:hypothetical protein
MSSLVQSRKSCGYMIHGSRMTLHGERCTNPLNVSRPHRAATVPLSRPGFRSATIPGRASALALFPAGLPLWHYSRPGFRPGTILASCAMLTALPGPDARWHALGQLMT